MTDSKFIKLIDGKEYLLKSEVIKGIAEARAHERERIVVAIEAQEQHRTSRDSPAYWLGMADAARIARNGGSDE